MQRPRQERKSTLSSTNLEVILSGKLLKSAPMISYFYIIFVYINPIIIGYVEYLFTKLCEVVHGRQEQSESESLRKLTAKVGTLRIRDTIEMLFLLCPVF